MRKKSIPDSGNCMYKGPEVGDSMGGIQGTPSLDWVRWCLKRRMSVDKSGWGDPLACSIEILQGLFHYICFFFFKYNLFTESQISHRGILLKRRGKDEVELTLPFSLCFCLHKDSGLCGCHLPFCAQFSSCLASLSHAPLFSIFLVALSPPFSSSLENSAHSTMWVPSCSVQAC